MEKKDLQALTVRAGDVMHNYLYKKEKGLRDARVHFILVLVHRGDEETLQTTITSSNKNVEEVSEVLLSFGMEMASEDTEVEITTVSEFRKANEN